MSNFDKWFMKFVNVLLLIVAVVDCGFTGYAFLYLPDTMVIVGMCCLILTGVAYLVIERLAKS